MSILDDFQRANRRNPCPVCEKTDWCLVSRDDPMNPSRVVCARIESPIPFGEAGWLHRLRDDGWRPAPVSQRTVRRCSSRPVNQDFAGLVAKFRSAVRRESLQHLAGTLGLSVAGLQRLQIGWAAASELRRVNTKCKGPGAWAFPMTDNGGNVRGIRLRTPEGFKYAVTGGNQGLFVPTELNGQEPLLIAEGPTDTAALLDLGFDAVGRPSCNGGSELVKALMRSRTSRDAIIVADSDEPGRRGADALARKLLPHCSSVRVIEPPAGAKDVRDWKRVDGQYEDVMRVIDGTEPYGFAVRGNVRGRRATHV